MSRLTALVPSEVCAAALGRDWPDDLDGQVRCIDEGTRSLGLAFCCAPWSAASEDAALRTGLGDHADPGADLPTAPVGDSASGAHPNLESFPSHMRKSSADFDVDAVAAGLARVPGAPPVLGRVSGPLTWGIRVGSGAALEDAVDAASDLASARVRALVECGVERVVVVESVDARHSVDAELAIEAHRPILRVAQHLRTDVLLVTAASGAVPPPSFGYRLWASADGCADGLAFLPSGAFTSVVAADRCIEDNRARLASANTVLTSTLGVDADPDAVRRAAGVLAALGRESSA